MEPQWIVLAFELLGGLSCAMAVVRSGRASLALAGGAAAALAALGADAGNPAGAIACGVLAAGALGCALVAGPWAEASPAGPLAVVASMGFYLRGASTVDSTDELLVLLVAALVASRIVGRRLSGDSAQVGATALALGVLALGLASKTGSITFWNWSFDPALLAYPLLAAAVAGVHSATGGELPPVLASLVVAELMLTFGGSMAEACGILAVTEALYVVNAPSRPRAVLEAVVEVVLVALVVLGSQGERLMAWLRAPADVYGSGFDLHVFLDALSEMEPVGTGAINPDTVITADSVSVYVLGQAASAFGWAGLALPLACVASAVVVSLDALPALAPTEKSLALALLACFATFALGNVVYVFHLLPIPAMVFPLLSPGASSMLAFVLAGEALSRVVGQSFAAEKNPLDIPVAPSPAGPTSDERG